MCGRYYIADDDRLGEMVRRLAEREGLSVKTGEILPGDTAPVYVGGSRLKLTALKWGTELNGKTLINARSETAGEKKRFCGALNAPAGLTGSMAETAAEDCRLLVPASAYFEWDEKKVRHCLGRKETGLYMAGLKLRDRFVILTRASEGETEKIHSRMPVIFDREDGLCWLRSGGGFVRALTDEIGEKTLPGSVRI